MDLQTTVQIVGIIFLVGMAAYVLYQNDKFEKAGGWSGKPKANKVK